MSATTTTAVPNYGHPLPNLLLYTLPPIALALILHPLLPIILPDSILEVVTIPARPALPALQANIGFSLLAFVGAVIAVPYVGHAFIDKGLKGRDLLKPGGRTSGPWVYVSAM
jgi:UDP-N-acetylglucosamine--dolichyl-phosphate N-acetylglucosaminephosphotransferase